MQRDEIADRIIAEVGSIGPERVQRIRELVGEARMEGPNPAGSGGARVGQSMLGVSSDDRRATSDPADLLDGAVSEIERWWDREHEKLRGRVEALERAMPRSGDVCKHGVSVLLRNTCPGCKSEGRARVKSTGGGADEGRVEDESLRCAAQAEDGVQRAREVGGRPAGSRQTEANPFASSPASPASVPECIDVVFDGPPSHESGRFVEVEDMQGRSVRVGEWIDRKDGYWALRIPLASRAPRPAPQPSVEAVRALVEAADAMLEEPEGDSSKPTWALIDDYEKARAALFALPAPDAPKPASERDVVLEMPETDSGPLGRAHLEALHRLLAPVLDAAGFAPGQETAQKAIARLLGQWRSGLEPRVQPASEAGKPPTIEEMAQAERAASLKACGSWHRGTDAGYAAMRALCLASRAPAVTIEQAVDALLRVQPYKSSYETGASGLVYRADVEQVMRALFERRSK